MDTITGFCPPETVSSADATEVMVMPAILCRRWRNSLLRSVSVC